MPTTPMAWLSDSLQGRQSNPTEAKSDLEWREGEYDPPADKRVNKRSYGSGRTLLAWRRLMVIRRFMPDDPMRLLQTIQNAVESAFLFNNGGGYDQRRTSRSAVSAEACKARSTQNNSRSKLRLLRASVHVRSFVSRLQTIPERRDVESEHAKVCQSGGIKHRTDAARTHEWNLPKHRLL